MKLTKRTDAAISRMIRVFLLAEMLHIGQILLGAMAAVFDGSTEVGFPFEFAGWGSYCFGACSHFWPGSLLATILFWAAAATGWAWWQDRRDERSGLRNCKTGANEA